MAQKKKTKKPNIQDHMPSAEEAQKELATATSVDDFFGKEGIFSRLFADTLEQMLEAELTEELGYEPYDVKGRNSGNSRNGNYQRKMRSSGGDVEIKVPRDRNGEFHSELLKKNTNEIEDKIFTMYAKGMSTRDIQDILEDLYGIHVSPTTISKITDKVWELVEIWQNRPLDQIYAIVYLDAIHVKLRREGKIDNVAVYNVLGVNLEGRKDVLGNWVGDGGEGSQFLAQRSFRSAGTRRTGYLHRCGGRPEWVQGCYSACFSENKSSALHHPSNPAEPEIHHLERQKKAFTKDLKTIYKATTREEAEANLVRLSDTWSGKYAVAVRSWETNWEELATFFEFPKEIRRLIYTTNTVEAYNRQLRKVIKNKSSFPTPEAIRKQLYLATQDIMKKWTVPLRNWPLILNQLAIRFEDRFPL